MPPHNSLDGPPPPYSETDAYTFSSGSRYNHPDGADDDVSIAPSSSNSNIIYTPPESPSDTQFSFSGPHTGQHTTASAQAYFDSRPPLRSPAPHVTITIAITSDSVPSDLPYPYWASDRYVSEQDWQTFVNYLIPGHAARSNLLVIDRKTRTAEPSTSDGMTEAQLAALKSSENVPFSSQHVDATIREWNDGFFEPRGVSIGHTSPAEPTVALPQPDSESSREPAAGIGQSQSQPQQRSSWWRNPFSFVDGNNGSVRVGPLHIEGTRVSLGSTTVDHNGVCWRGPSSTYPQFEVNSRGVRWGPPPGAHPIYPRPFGHGGGQPRTASPGGCGRGRRREGREHEPERRRRDHSRNSANSSSSSSSSSSSDSDSSIGSLPACDDLEDVQLLKMKESVRAWLSHPDQPVTKGMMKQAKADIKAAKKSPSPPYNPLGDQTRMALRRDAKDLLQQFKAFQKQQKAAQKAATKSARKESRQQKREEWRERRRAEKCERRAERDADRHSRRSRRHPHHHHHPPPPPPHHHAAHPFDPMGQNPIPTGPPNPATSSPPPAFGFGMPGPFGGGPFGPWNSYPHPHSHSPFHSPFHEPYFGRRSGHHRGRGRDRDRGQGRSQAHEKEEEEEKEDATEQAHRTASEAMATAQNGLQTALAQAAQHRDKALAEAQIARENASRAAEESHRAAMETVRRSLAFAGQARSQAMAEAERQRSAAAEESRRAMEEAERYRSSAAEESRRAIAEAERQRFSAVEEDRQEMAEREIQAMKSQIAAKKSQVKAHEARAENFQMNGSGKGKGIGSSSKHSTGVQEREELMAVRRLREEMEVLERRVETMRIESDEAFARRLAESEGDGDQCWDGWK